MIRTERQGGVATLWLDRPAARNAIPVAGWQALARQAADLARGDAGAVLIRSATPGVFSAGADLAELARLADAPGERAPFRAAMAAGIEAVAALPMPVVAAVDGGCFGAAVALALAADVIVAGQDAHFAVPPARLGIGYPAGDVARLAARVGRGQAARLLFTGAPVDAAEACRIGLADLIGDCAALAAGIAGNDAAALRLLKRMLADPADPGHAGAFEASFASPTFRAGTARYRPE